MELVRRRSRIPAVVSALVVTFCLGACATAFAGEEDARAPSPGARDQRGIELAGGRIWVSAFVNVAFESLKDQPEEVNVDDVGVLVRWDVVDRLSLFAAIEIEDLLGWMDGEKVWFADHRPAVERLHADIALGSGTTLRVGKRLTPFGIWNPIRRAPLTWTIDRPLVTDVSFPLHVTGISLSHRGSAGAWSIDGELYGQPAGELDRISDEKSADAMVGGRLSAGRAVADGFATLGLQGVWFEDPDSDNQEYAVGLDLDLSIAGQMITSEVTLSDGEIDGEAVQWGGYVQVVHPIWKGLYGVVRGEIVGLDRRNDYRNLVLGLAWRAETGRWILKLNYQFSDNVVDDRTDGVSAALSFLF